MPAHALSKPEPTTRGGAGPFPWIHLGRIVAIVLAACVAVGALSAPPVATADVSSIQSLRSFFTRPWSPQTSDAEKLGTAYVYDEDGNLISETGTGGPNSTGTTDYIYLPTANGPMPIAAVINGQIYAIHSDHLNTPRRIDNAQGQTVWQWAYSAFGDEKPTTAHNRFANLGVTPNAGTTGISEVVFNLRHPGQYYDKESGLFDNYYRSLDPRSGRYTQPDPIGLNGGWNRVGYANGNPLSFVDPSGLTGEFRNPRDMQLLEGGGGGPMVGGESGGGFGARGLRGGGSLFRAGAEARTGRLGNQATRDHIDQVSCRLEERGWTINGGGGRGPEEYLPGPDGARKGSSYPDITAEKNGHTLRVNTVDTRADGVTPTTRETTNATRIRSQTGDHLLLIPKP